MKHTPLPWDVDAMGNIWAKDAKVCGMSAVPSQALGYREKTCEEHAGNARFIVRACNNHYELVDALETAQAALTEAAGNDDPDWCEIGIAESYIKSVLDSVKVNSGAA